MFQIDFHDWITVQILLYYWLQFHSDIASVGQSIVARNKGPPPMKTTSSCLRNIQKIFEAMEKNQSGYVSI